MDNAIHLINLYPVDMAIGFPNIYPLRIVINFIGWIAFNSYPAFEQLELEEYSTIDKVHVGHEKLLTFVSCRIYCLLISYLSPSKQDLMLLGDSVPVDSSNAV